MISDEQLRTFLRHVTFERDEAVAARDAARGIAVELEQENAQLLVRLGVRAVFGD